MGQLRFGGGCRSVVLGLRNVELETGEFRMMTRTRRCLSGVHNYSTKTPSPIISATMINSQVCIGPFIVCMYVQHGGSLLVT